MQISLKELEHVMTMRPASELPPVLGDELDGVLPKDARHDPEVQDIVAKVNAMPDERADLVDQLRAQIEAGTYNVTADDIADLMVRRALADQMR